MSDPIPEPVRFWLSYWPEGPHSDGAAAFAWTRIETAVEQLEAGDIVYLHERGSPAGLVGWAEVTSKQEVERIYDDGDEEGITPPFKTYMTWSVSGMRRGRLTRAITLTTLGQYSELRSLRRLTSEDAPHFELLRSDQAMILNAILADHGCSSLPDLHATRTENILYDSVPPPVVVTDCWREIKRYFSRHPERLYDIEPRQFEALVADILRDLGFDTELTQLTRDGGRDIYAYVRNAVTSFLIFVECKRWSARRKVGIQIVQRVYGAAKAGGAHQSMIVTTSFFTEPAREEQKKMSTELVLADYNTLKTWLRSYRNDPTRANSPHAP